jgi:C4-dicarboxylate transporter DctM subunit
LLGLAFVLGLYLVRAQVPAHIAETFTGITTNPILMVLLINLFLIIIHSVLETVSSIIIVIPVFMPLMLSMHIDPIAFGIIVLVNSAIGINLPPIGFCLYTASSISGIKLEQATRAILPFILALLIDLLLVILLPEISLFLPKLFNM